ncbi:DUF177 domain-containing protein [bacterium]|nr:DUF177 domain-containing protein [bacterium]
MKSTLFKISIRELETKKTSFDITENAKNLGIEGKFSSINVKGSFQIKGRKVFIFGRMIFDAELLCSRCGTLFEANYTHSFKLVFLPEDKRKLDEFEDADVFYYGGEIIDFADHIRDFVYLSIPIKPLCSVDCKGIEY